MNIGSRGPCNPLAMLAIIRFLIFRDFSEAFQDKNVRTYGNIEASACNLRYFSKFLQKINLISKVYLTYFKYYGWFAVICKTREANLKLLTQFIDFPLTIEL